METQFITFDVAGTKKPEGGWPVGTFGAQGTIKPIESGYYRFTFRRTDGAWRIRHPGRHPRHPLRCLTTHGPPPTPGCHGAASRVQPGVARRPRRIAQPNRNLLRVLQRTGFHSELNDLLARSRLLRLPPS
ncbi:hypothetical protein [Actinacidiphila glaucinigra]|uniref:hypothetical protein n=1 Tax=Actinacidiphila glaucinigra TaxID=235986 RepID=UPI003828E762